MDKTPQTVPLVYYDEGGVRVVIGRATVTCNSDDDGYEQMEVVADIDPEYAGLVMAPLVISLGPLVISRGRMI